MKWLGLNIKFSTHKDGRQNPKPYKKVLKAYPYDCNPIVRSDCTESFIQMFCGAGMGHPLCRNRSRACLYFSSVGSDYAR